MPLFRSLVIQLSADMLLSCGMQGHVFSNIWAFSDVTDTGEPAESNGSSPSPKRVTSVSPRAVPRCGVMDERMGVRSKL